MKKTIQHLLSHAPQIDNVIVKMMRDDMPANALRRYLECQVVLKSGYAMAGILTTDDDQGTLRMCSIAKDQQGKVLIADQRFTADDVQVVIVGRELPEQLVKPVNPTRNGSPIILGQ